MPEIHELIETFPTTGRVEWIGVAAQRRGEIEPKDAVELRAGTGIDGEHHAGGGRSHRQVTLIQAEHLPVVAALLGKDRIDPADLRRNVVVSGINLLALKRGRFRIGDVLLEGTGPCAPCSRMEENLGPGGYNALRGHGGVTAIVLEAGTIRLGDPVAAVQGCQPEKE